MTIESHQQTFIGKGAIHNEPWHRSETEPPITDPYAYSHPRHYIADDGLIAAVNTALLLNKPLLVTGNPGTGNRRWNRSVVEYANRRNRGSADVS